MHANLNHEFPLSKDIIYLNHAGIGPWPQRTATAVEVFAQENIQIGATNYPKWLKKEAFLRQQFRELINADSIDDIALVKNTSEALSFVALGLNWQNGDNIVSTNEEFSSNRIPWEALVNKGVSLRQANIRNTDDPEQTLFELVDKNTRLITVSSIQFSSGIRLNIEKIGQFCRQRNILYCIDSIQSLGAFKFDVQAYHADFVMADGHKWMLGPEGLGVFYTSTKAREQLELTQYGWHMIEEPSNYDNQAWEIAQNARRYECGSSNMLGIHALSASLSLLLEIGLETIETLVLEKTAYLIDNITQIPTFSLLSPSRNEVRSGIVVFRHKHIDNNKLYNHLRNNGVICALRGGGIRFSTHFYITESRLQKALELASSC